MTVEEMKMLADKFRESYVREGQSEISLLAAVTLEVGAEICERLERTEYASLKGVTKPEQPASQVRYVPY